ncbi:HesB/IscA family protein [Ferrovum myxofaciens]|jgi:iron-sulfur cluster assembly protein|nr:iron-sulfur cluster assembly accessory protein [Ferrovum myxofaciens]NDU89175.1 iron-sulfur cluster assembly accessory protein [Ferrovum sp.]MBU6995311.1 iron-sulfur cluster assembly accessory protein [Ferrovum myxofaciens]QKE39065.1 MAG: iron-sulfur cluster assembly accessory protein [Ferrovum myxofaciens]QWY74301.1 MAG: iron-sulfur cluster assembly accessory protein [Ferrovum myxofaciens]QWY77051.1 MAG: iron-sulfur cluster assembly accessory protein [Ferrovum myxofaciens]
MTITLTESAAQQIHQSLAKRGKGIGLRFGTKTSGCSGLAYVVDYADDVREGEVTFETGGTLVVVHQDHLPFLNGTVIDYQRTGLNASFKFNNPNVTDSCGCGESFTTRTAA